MKNKVFLIILLLFIFIIGSVSAIQTFEYNFNIKNISIDGFNCLILGMEELSEAKLEIPRICFDLSDDKMIHNFFADQVVNLSIESNKYFNVRGPRLGVTTYSGGDLNNIINGSETYILIDFWDLNKNFISAEIRISLWNFLN